MINEQTKRKVYYVEISENECEHIEGEIRKRIVNIITKEITEHSKELATSILQGKGLIKKKWYQDKGNL